MEILCSESEIADVLAHETGHVKLGRYTGLTLPCMKDSLISQNRPGNSQAVSKTLQLRT